MSAHEHDLIVIGGGPAGYVAALRAAQLGLDVACVEKERLLGGTCLRVGCIPSKELLEASELYRIARTQMSEFGVEVSGVTLNLQGMLDRKDRTVRTLAAGIEGLFAKGKVTRYLGHARFETPEQVVVEPLEGETRALRSKHRIIATGSVPSPLPGVELDGRHVGTSTDALSWDSVPQHLVVIGAGVIGLELGSVWSRLGAEVTVVEYLDRILPGTDEEIAKVARRILAKQGLHFRLGEKVQGTRIENGSVYVDLADSEPLVCDRVLLAVGRKPNTEGLGLDAAGVSTDGKGRIYVDDRLRCEADGTYACGDVVRGPMLAHKAEEEGISCAEFIGTGRGHVNYETIPNVVYTSPEIATVGRSEAELQEDGVPYKKGSFPFAANGRARIMGETEGIVKILAHERTDRILGVHMVGPHTGELIQEAVAAMSFGASSEDLARLCHAHPTLSESLKEAALSVSGRTLHR